MNIDIIMYTEAQFASLTEEQLLQVQAAQIKKNRLDRELEENLVKEKNRLIDNGTYLSSLWSLYAEKVRAEHDAEVENLRDGLLFYLQYSLKASEQEMEGVFYQPDYALDVDGRYELVKNAYIEEYSDPHERYMQFKKDKVALKYLGEAYYILHQYFALEK